jgi:hypothetical protein
MATWQHCTKPPTKYLYLAFVPSRVFAASSGSPSSSSAGSAVPGAGPHDGSGS